MGTEVILEFDFMKRDLVCSHITLYRGGIVKVENFASDPVDCAFGMRTENLGLTDLEVLWEYRCFERGRVDCDDLVKRLGLREYNRLEIIKKTHGIMSDDHYWIRFKGEDIKYKDISVR